MELRHSGLGLDPEPVTITAEEALAAGLWAKQKARHLTDAEDF